jgi:hypothetical protein
MQTDVIPKWSAQSSVRSQRARLPRSTQKTISPLNTPPPHSSRQPHSRDLRTRPAKNGSLACPSNAQREAQVIRMPFERAAQRTVHSRAIRTRRAKNRSSACPSNAQCEERVHSSFRCPLKRVTEVPAIHHPRALRNAEREERVIRHSHALRSAVRRTGHPPSALPSPNGAT